MRARNLFITALFLLHGQIIDELSMAGVLTLLHKCEAPAAEAAPAEDGATDAK